MISNIYQCIFIHVPKTAGESIETVLMGHPNWEKDDPKYEGLNLPQDSCQGEDKHYKISQWINHDKFESYFKFSIVRNPWASADSFYKYRKKRDNFSHTFPEWVKCINPKFWHEFLAPLPYLLLGDKIGVDFVGKFENLNKDWIYICERLYINTLDLPHKNNSGVSDYYIDHYDQRSKDIVYQHLKRDIEHFNYSFGE